MLKSKDIGLIFLSIGTFLIIGSLISALFAPPPIVFIVVQITGWCLYVIALIFINLIKKEYDILKLKNGFSVKTGNLIFIICVLAILLGFPIIVSLGSYIYTGEIPDFLTLYIFFFILNPIIIVLFERRRKKKSNNNVADLN